MTNTETEALKQMLIRIRDKTNVVFVESENAALLKLAIRMREQHFSFNEIEDLLDGVYWEIWGEWA